MESLILLLLSCFPMYAVGKIFHIQYLNDSTNRLHNYLNFNVVYSIWPTQFGQEILGINKEYLNNNKVIYIPFTFEKKKVVVKDYKLNKENLLFKSEILIYKDLEC